jgi:YVTN family beta-propeller protein
MMHQWISRAGAADRAVGTTGRPGPAPPRRGGWRGWGLRRWRLAAVLAAALALPGVAAVGQASPAWASSCQLPGCVPVGGYPFGVAADPATGTVFVANIDGSVSVISEATGAVAATIPVGLYPEAVAADSQTGTVYVANYGSSNISVIGEAASPTDDAVVATLGTSSHPLAVATGPAAGTVWVEESGGVLQEITEAANPASDTLGPPISLPGGYPYLNDPQTLAAAPPSAADPDGTVWATDGDGVSVIDAATGSVITTIPLSGSPEAVAVDPNSGTVFVAGYSSGTVSVISEATDTVTATIQIPPQAGTPPGPMAVAVDSGTVYVSSFVGSLTLIGAATDTITGTIDVGGAPWGGPGLAGMAFDPSTGNVYLAADAYNELYAILSQSISFTAPATGVVGQTATLTATATSGLPVTYTVDSSSGAGVCTVSGNTVSYAHAGSCVIDANQAGNPGYYFPAAQVQQTITVNQAPSFILDSPPTTDGALVGQGSYGYTFAAAGSPAVTYALAGAPSWLTINSATGAVTGTVPAGTSSFSYSVTASNAAGTATAGPFTVKAGPGGLTADVAISMKCPASLTAGATGTCTLTVQNNGPEPVTQIEVAALLPYQLPEVSCGSGCSLAANGLAVTWTVNPVGVSGLLGQKSLINPVGASGLLGQKSLTLTVQAGPPGTVLVQAAADSQVLDTSQGNNSASQAITIDP